MGGGSLHLETIFLICAGWSPGDITASMPLWDFFEIWAGWFVWREELGDRGWGKNSFLVATLLFCNGGTGLTWVWVERKSTSSLKYAGIYCPELANFSNITGYCIHCRGLPTSRLTLLCWRSFQSCTNYNVFSSALAHSKNDKWLPLCLHYLKMHSNKFACEIPFVVSLDIHIFERWVFFFFYLYKLVSSKMWNVLRPRSRAKMQQNEKGINLCEHFSYNFTQYSVLSLYLKLLVVM